MKNVHFLLFLILFCFFTLLDKAADAEQLRDMAYKAEDTLKKKISNLSEPQGVGLEIYIS